MRHRNSRTMKYIDISNRCNIDLMVGRDVYIWDGRQAETCVEGPRSVAKLPKPSIFS